jgi:hypothetical protein
MIAFYGVVKSQKPRHFSQGQAVWKSTGKDAAIKKRRDPKMRRPFCDTLTSTLGQGISLKTSRI